MLKGFMKEDTRITSSVNERKNIQNCNFINVSGKK
jgi:hypothetical protein